MRFGKYALLLCALAACNEPTAPDGSHGEFLLEIEYVNYAWTPQFFGFVVDARGDIYSYDRADAPWPHRAANVVTEAQLNEKFSLNRELVATRDSAEVPTLAMRINQITANQLSPQKNACADAGALTYRAYRYHADDRTYVPVLLRVEGDLAQENTSQAAQDLITYIRSLGLLEELLGCDP
jgi:hypothetical protein